MRFEAVFRSGVTAVIGLGALAAFLILGIAGVSWRTQCAGAASGLCADEPSVAVVDTDAVTGSVPATTMPEFEVGAAPEPQASPQAQRLTAATELLEGTFDTLVAPDGPPSGAAVAALTSAEPAPAAKSAPSHELTKRVVRSVPVSPDGKPLFTASAASATPRRPVDDPFAQVMVPTAAEAADAESASIAARQDIEPLAYAPSGPAIVAPVPEEIPEGLDRDGPATPDADIRTVRGSGVNVRSGPSSSRGRVFALAGGEQVTVSDEQRGWLKITDDRGRTGWLYKDYVR